MNAGAGVSSHGAGAEGGLNFQESGLMSSELWIWMQRVPRCHTAPARSPGLGAWDTGRLTSVSQDAQVWLTCWASPLKLNFVICRMDIMEANSQDCWEEIEIMLTCKSLCRREPFRQDLADRAPLLPLRTIVAWRLMGWHQPDADPSHSAPLQGQLLPDQGLGRHMCGGDLFGSPAGCLAHTTDFDTLERRPAEPKSGDRVSWHQGPRAKLHPLSSSTPTLTPRENKYRLIRQTL